MVSKIERSFTKSFTTTRVFGVQSASSRCFFSASANAFCAAAAASAASLAAFATTSDDNIFLEGLPAARISICSEVCGGGGAFLAVVLVVAVVGEMVFISIGSSRFPAVGLQAQQKDPTWAVIFCKVSSFALELRDLLAFYHSRFEPSNRNQLTCRVAQYKVRMHRERSRWFTNLS